MARTPERIDGYAPIRDYAVIGNKHTAALVALDGAIDWLCLHSFDGPSVFGALLDSRAGGRATLAPAGPYTAERRYLPGTNVLETTFETEQGRVRVTDSMSLPVARPLSWIEIVRRVEAESGRVPMAWTVEPRFEYGSRKPQIEMRDGVPLFSAGRDVLAVQSRGAGDAEIRAEAAHGRFEATEEPAVLALSAFSGEPLSLGRRLEFVGRQEATAERWRIWSQSCEYDGPWREAVLRSALALDLLVDRETSAIAAAATMGLPEKVGGSRNFDYRYAWLRDMNLTLEAMLRLGYGEQVHASLAWILNATRATHPRLRPIYQLDGTAHLPNSKLSLAGYRDSAPVTLGNSAQTQLQLGAWGDVFDMTWRYASDGNALDDEAGRRMAELADFICLIWQHPDASLWELGDYKDYTQSKLACWLSLRRAEQLAEKGLIPDEGIGRWRSTHEEIREYVRSRCWSESRQAYARSAGSDELDAAVLLSSRGAFVEEEPDRLSSTIDAIREGLGAGGPLLYRYTGMREQENAFLACSFWVVEALARVGRVDEAAETMDALVALGNDVGLYSEEMEPESLEMRGNLPQALTHLSLVNAAFVLEQRQEG